MESIILHHVITYMTINMHLETFDQDW